MLSKEALAAYRAMGPARRFEMTLGAIRENTPALFFGEPDVVARRFALIRKKNDEFNRLVRERLGKAGFRHDASG
jgi:hypothetical protein